MKAEDTRGGWKDMASKAGKLSANDDGQKIVVRADLTIHPSTKEIFRVCCDKVAFIEDFMINPRYRELVTIENIPTWTEWKDATGLDAVFGDGTVMVEYENP